MRMVMKGFKDPNLPSWTNTVGSFRLAPLYQRIKQAGCYSPVNLTTQHYSLLPQ